MLEIITSPISQLFTPFRFLKVKSYDLDITSKYIPFILSFLTVMIFNMIMDNIRISKCIPDISEFIGILSGLYMTALSIIATNESKHLDALPDGNVPTLDEKKLTRRELLCLLFGYLTSISLMIFIISIFASLAKSSNAMGILSKNVLDHINVYKSALLILYYFLFYSLIINTLLSINFIFIKLPNKITNK